MRSTAIRVLVATLVVVLTGACDAAPREQDGREESSAAAEMSASAETQESPAASGDGSSRTPTDGSAARTEAEGGSGSSNTGRSTSGGTDLFPSVSDSEVSVSDSEVPVFSSGESSSASLPERSTEGRESLVTLRELSIEGVAPIVFHPDPLNGSRYGTGIALLDLDGSGRLDLFVGADGLGVHPACVYRNVSTPTELRLEKLEGACGNLGEMTTGMAVPGRDGQGQELLMVGRNAASVLRLEEDGTPTVEEIYRLPPWEEAPEMACMATSVLIADLTLDGLPWALIGCGTGVHSRLWERLPFAYNRVLRRGAQGWEQVNLEALHPWFHNPSSTLAMAMVDSAGTGLWSPLIINDTFSTVGIRMMEYDPGGVLERCAPGEGCVWRERLLADDPSAWGSFMGAGQLRIGEEDYLYLTDWGPNRLLRMQPDIFVDEASLRGVEVAHADQWPVFGWSVVVDDFSGDGRDDMLVTNGSPRASALDDDAHRNVLLLQRPDGTFAAFGEEAGLSPPSAEASTVEGFLTSSRGAVKADLLRNGRMEIVLLDHHGPLRVLQEVVTPSRPLRCSVDPVPRIGAHTGTGYSFGRDREGPFRTWDIQGHMLVGAPSRLLLPWQEGWLRFPSGAVIPWNCEGGAGPIVLEEPKWVRLEWPAEESPLLIVEAPWLFSDADEVAIRIAYLAEDPQQSFDLTPIHESYRVLDGAAPSSPLSLEIPVDATHLMLSINDRWVPHRFSLADGP